MKKNVLIISDGSIDKIGGGQTYNRLLVENLSNKFNFYEVFYSEKLNTDFAKNKLIQESYYIKTKTHQKWNSMIIKIALELIYNVLNYYIIKKQLKEIIKINNIDIIIAADCKYLYKPVSNKNTHTIYVQHRDDKFFIKKINYINVFYYLWYKMNHIFYGKKINFVTFTNDNAQILFKNCCKKNLFICPLAKYKKNEVRLHQNKVRNKIVYIGRIHKEKNIKFLTEISKELEKENLKIDFYGPDYDNLLKDYKNFYGPKNQTEINQILNETKILILASDSEGFPFVVVEALSKGVPVILYDSFTNAKFLVNDERGKLLDELNVVEFKNAIKEIYYLNDSDYLKMQNNCLRFARENLTLENFIKNWENIIEEIKHK